MISSHEHSDIVHIMKMNRFSLIDSDTSHLDFRSRYNENEFTVTILAAENEPKVTVRQNELVMISETVRSIDDLKIFLEEQLYRYINKVEN